MLDNRVISCNEITQVLDVSCVSVKNEFKSFLIIVNECLLSPYRHALTD